MLTPHPLDRKPCADFYRTQNAIIKQYTKLFKIDGIKLTLRKNRSNILKKA
jgi:ATP-dependent protease Clp ATPase subunit